MASLANNVSSGNPNIDGLLGQYRWSAWELTWGVPSRGKWSGYDTGTEPYYFYEELTSAQDSAARSVMLQLDGIANLGFRELTFDSLIYPEEWRPENADIRFGQTLYGPDGDFFVAFAYLPAPVSVGSTTADALSGDVWVYNDEEDPYPGAIFAEPRAGNYEYFTFLHETGHAVGLKHPHEIEGGFGAMPLATDHLSYTVMSYRSYQGQSTDGDGYANGDWDFPQTYMIWDIAALQHMYGADMTYRSGNTLYVWDPNTGQTRVDGSVWINPGANRVFQTIYDAGGFDTYDFSAYSNDLSVDLNPEAWTITSTAQLANLGDGHFAPGNIANARLHQNHDRGLIEKAVGGSGNDRLIGNRAQNTLVGNAGDDFLDGGIALDTMIGGLGNDRYVISQSADIIIEAVNEGVDSVETGVSYTLSANVENLTSTVNTALTLTGNDIANIIIAGTGNDVIDGKGGADTMNGGAGNDTYHVDNEGDLIVDSAGTDTVVVTASYVLSGDAIENITLGGSASINATGNGLANTITGNGGDNMLDGAGGVDVLSGGAGNDVYIIDNLNEAVENANSGIDEIRTTFASFTLGANFENLTGLAASGQTLTGNAAVNVITGTAFDDVIDGLAGADTMIGGLGADLFKVDNGLDLVVEQAAGGIDLVQSSTSYVLGAEIENLTLLGPDAFNGTGNALDNVIIGNSLSNTLDGGAGADILDGGAGNDTYIVDAADQIVDSSGIDFVRAVGVGFTLGAGMENLTGLNALGQTLTGNELANSVVGAAGNDMIDGGAGSDTLRGGLGHDIYFVDLGSDTIVELAGEGDDEVRTSLSSYTLGSNLERLAGLASTGQSLYGNGLDNVIIGNVGNDRLNGDAGIDLLTGGLGDDIYTIDALDIVVELGGGGIDTVITNAAAYTLAAFVESLTGILGAGQALTGNGLDNVIQGGSGGDILDGAGGADSLNGGAGGDIYILGAGDSLVEAFGAAGVDEVRTAIAAYTLAANVENLTGLSAAGQGLTGNDLANRILGGTGSDLIDGGLGADEMRGGLGNDVFIADNGADTIVELDTQGIDEVRTSLASFSIAGFAHVENLTGAAGDQSLTGNGWNNLIDGGLGADAMAGGGGHDVYVIDNVGDTVTEQAGAGTDEIRSNFATVTLAGFANVENLTGGSANQTLTGNGSDNRIDGGAGADAMAGGAGNDVYVVDNLGDTVTELAGEGIDEIRTNLGSKAPPERAVYVLPDFIENLTGTSAFAQGVRDNSLDNVIVMGNGHDLVVADAGGVDSVSGGVGNDFFYYGGTLTAADTTNGGANIDTVALLGDYGSGITFTAANLVGVERMALYTSLYLPGTGPNNYDITMNDANVAAGSEFFVTAASLQSNESLAFNGASESDGRFTIHGGAGADTITGGAGGDFVLGNAGNDTLFGLGGVDFLIGGLGADQMRGGAGSDRFVYQSAAQSTATAIDQILDFQHADRIDLSAIDANGNAGDGNSAFTFIGASAFGNVAGQLRAWQSGADWFVEGDVNGDGLADLVIQVTLPDATPLGVGDFFL